MLRHYLSLIRFSHTVFALPFALMSALLAWQSTPFQWLHAIGILLCMVFARSFAMAFNRLVDRHIDARNPRTANRHLPAGVLSVSGVTLFTLAMAGLFVASTLMFRTNLWPLYLSGPVLLFVAGYSLTKRFTALAHFWLGAALMLAPLAAWIALRGMMDLETPLLLGGAVFVWVAGFDILYACQDADFDRREGLHSVPARFGVKNSLKIAAACHAVMVGFLIALNFVNPLLHFTFLGGLICIAVLLIYEHSIVKPNDLSRVNQAFFQVNGIISFGLLLITILQIYVVPGS